MKKQQNRGRIAEIQERILRHKKRISSLLMEISSLQDQISDLNGDLSMLVSQEEKGVSIGTKGKEEKVEKEE